MKKSLPRPVLRVMSILRRHLTRLKIRQEAKAQSRYGSVQVGGTTKLEILPLYEAAATEGLQSGSGVSYLIRTDHATILFDLGNNPSAASPSPLEQNMDSLGVKLDEVGMLVLSHRHPDHIGGYAWWGRKTFSVDGKFQPLLGSLPIYVPEQVGYPGSRPTLTKVPTQLAQGVMTSGIFTFFEPYLVGWIAPRDREQALIVNVTGLGLVLITGCGHMGLEVLLERAEAISDIPVVGVVGGLHYVDATVEALQPDIQLLQKRHPRLVALSPHDSSPSALEAFERAFPTSYQSIRVGEAITFSSK